VREGMSELVARAVMGLLLPNECMIRGDVGKRRGHIKWRALVSTAATRARNGSDVA
jgi:hypothetical protein